jgi:hypothetical protein
MQNSFAIQLVQRSLATRRFQPVLYKVIPFVQYGLNAATSL